MSETSVKCEKYDDSLALIIMKALNITFPVNKLEIVFEACKPPIVKIIHWTNAEERDALGMSALKFNEYELHPKTDTE